MGQDGTRTPELFPRKVSGFLFHPARAFRDARDAPFTECLWYYAGLLGFATVLTTAVAVTRVLWMAQRYPMMGYHAPLLQDAATVAAAVLLYGTAMYGAIALLLHLPVFVCGGRKGPVRTVSAFLYVATPLHLFSWIAVALALSNSPSWLPILAALFFWTIALAVTGLREFHGLSAVRAVLPFLITAAIVLVAVPAVYWLAVSDTCGGGGCYHVTSATAACSGDTIIVMYQGGPDAERLVNITVSINGEERFPQLGAMSGVLPVGSSTLYTGPFSSRDHVIATAYFSDGARQVVVDEFLGCGSLPPATTRPPAPAAAQPAAAAGTPAVTGCGGVPFDPAVSGCCGTTVHSLYESVCCSGTVYDNATTGCCAGRPYKYLAQDCCGGTIYNYTTSYCCNNRVATDNCDWGIADINVTNLRMVQGGGGLPALAGTVVNHGTITYTSVHMAVACYDADGQRVDAFIAGSPPGREGILKGGSMVRFGDVHGGGSLDFVVQAKDPATRTMKVLSVEAFYSRGSALTSFSTRPS